MYSKHLKIDWSQYTNSWLYRVCIIGKYKKVNESEVGEDKTTMTGDPAHLKSNPGLTLTDIVHDDTELEHFKVCKSKNLCYSE